MSVDPVAARGFELAADAYVRGRPSYPPEAIDWLAQRCALGPDATVVDVAAGTGKLTALLAARGARVIAVEPAAAMRAALAATVPDVPALEGTADALPLPDGSADTITVGQAYHWFAGEPALAEFARVLAPAGRLALVWNARDLDQPLWREVSRVIEPLRGGAPAHQDGRWRESLRATTRLRALEETRVRHTQLTDVRGVLDRVLSISFVAALAADRRAEVARELAALVADAREPIALHYTTEVFLYERAGP